MTHPADNDVRCEGLAPFCCNNPDCPVHGVTSPVASGTASRWCAVHDEPAAECWSAECLVPSADPETATSVIASLRARLDAVSDLADHLVGNEAAPLIREALNGYTPKR